MNNMSGAMVKSSVIFRFDSYTLVLYLTLFVGFCTYCLLFFFPSTISKGNLHKLHMSVLN